MNAFEQVKGRGGEYGVRHFRVLTATEFRLDELVSNGSALANARELIELGAVYVNDQRTCDCRFELSPRDLVRVHFEPRRFQLHQNLIPRIHSSPSYPLDCMVIDKPSGLPTHAQVDNAHENLLSFLKRDLRGSGHPLEDRSLLITHRLDVETSGLLIIALTTDAQVRINRELAGKKIIRRYHAWVDCPVETGLITHFMQPSFDAPKTVSKDPSPGWKECRMVLLACEKVEVECQVCWRLTIELQTGRSQQIRAQLAALGAPIRGDLIYGSKLNLQDPVTRSSAIALRAFELQFLP